MRTSTNLSGQEVYTWGGRTDKGDIVQTGVYFYVLDEGGHVETGKFAVIRK